MKNKTRIAVSMLLITGIFFGILPDVRACGPFTVDPLFSFTKHGYYPLGKYIGNEPGIVPNTYGRISLFPFYRQLNATPLSNAERGLVEKAIKNRIGIEEKVEPAGNSDSDNQPAYVAEWLMIRKKTLDSKTEIDTSKAIPEIYGYFENCLADSFKTATSTLRSRIDKHGVNENTRNWVNAQDAVFSNCGDDGKIPSAVPAGSPDWLKKDRDYQIAAAYFYNGKLPEALMAFEKIAEDSNSEWQDTARFVTARTLIREASFKDDEDTDGQKTGEKTDLLKKAQGKLENILTDSSMTKFHASAARLLGLVKFRVNGPARQAELAEKLTAATENQNMFNDLTDFIWLLDKPERKAYDVGSEIDAQEAEKKGELYYGDYTLKLRDLPAENRTPDLSDWLYTYQADDGFAHAFEKWKDTNSVHWFVSAISHATGDAPQTAELLSEAAKINRSSPAFATVRYHQNRLLLEGGNRAEARRSILEVFDANFSNLPVSTQNEFYSQRMIVSEGLDEFLEFAQRKAAVFIWSDDGNEEGDDLNSSPEMKVWQNRTMFDLDSVAFINHEMPLEMLVAAAKDPGLPAHLKKFVISAAWTRSFLLDNKEIETGLRPLMAKASPELRSYFSQYERTRTATENEAYGLLFILKNPILQPFVPPGIGRGEDGPESIDSIRGNWWCTDNVNPYEKSVTPEVMPDFLTEDQKSAAANEDSALRALGSSATNLARRSIAFAKANPAHRLTPQLLHLSVRSTRYGCGDTETGALSREAFTILHTKYPRSVWTKQTPYWFNGNGE